jgi:hypothetical protein
MMAINICAGEEINLNGRRQNYYTQEIYRGKQMTEKYLEAVKTIKRRL